MVNNANEAQEIRNTIHYVIHILKLGGTIFMFLNEFESNYTAYI